MKPLKVLDLFSGIGTFSYALDQIEVDGQKVFETVAFCEIDKDCHRVLNKHWPEVEIFTDVSQVSYNEFGFLHQSEDGEILRCVEDKVKIDVIVGGFPCTDISVAGKQKGLIDENGKTTRSGLWSQYKRLIQETQPKYVLIENVRNLLSNGIGTVLQDLSEIGYDAEWEVISARDVGQCHLRERLWIVAYPHRSPIRIKSEWSKTRWDDLQSSRESESGHNGETGNITASDSNGNGRGKGVSLQARNEGEGLQPIGNGQDGSVEHSTTYSRSKGLEGSGVPSRVSEKFSSSDSLSDCDGNNNEGPTGWDESSDLHYFRFWPSFATEEEKSEWWAEATSEFRDWRKTQPEICGIHDGPTTGLHEKFRRARIKQLGNGIIRSIAQIHGERIKYHEFSAEAHL